jgi:hypothetical protein
MANPHGNLAGWSDPEQEGWEQRALDRVAARASTQKRRYERRNSMTIFFDDPFRVLLDEGANRRNISLNGYARRAIAGYLAHDLELPFSEVTQHTAQPAWYDGRPPQAAIRRPDMGEGHGLWIIGDLH